MTVLLVATAGGHLSELSQLAPRLFGDGTERVWITNETPQSRSVLAREQVVFIPAVHERDVVGVMKSSLIARRILQQERVTMVVSTGSAKALGFLPYAALKAIPAHYIESATRTHGPSLTGRVLRYTPRVQLYTQHQRWARPPWKWIGGSVFDGFQAELGPSRPIRSAVVTLGTMVHGFRRLVERAQVLLPPEAEVLWQTGHTDVTGLGITPTPFLAADELAAAMRDADLVIGHAGIGTALGALEAGKIPILIPRQRSHGEIGDDHQQAIAIDLATSGLAIHRSIPELTSADLHTAACHAAIASALVSPLHLGVRT
jgi:UDP-N-acetylglucosamine transferase subunit ALG13